MLEGEGLCGRYPTLLVVVEVLYVEAPALGY